MAVVVTAVMGVAVVMVAGIALSHTQVIAIIITIVASTRIDQRQTTTIHRHQVASIGNEPNVEFSGPILTVIVVNGSNDTTTAIDITIITSEKHEIIKVATAAVTVLHSQAQLIRQWRTTSSRTRSRRHRTSTPISPLIKCASKWLL